MKKEYNFSKGVRGKFYNADAEFNLPIYLEAAESEHVRGLAVKDNTNHQSTLKKTKN